MSRFEKGIIFTNDDCIGCNKCISQCSVLGANISIIKNDKPKIHVDAQKCNHCGKCIALCSHKARNYIDDIDLFLNDLKNGKKFSLIVSSSFFTLYNENADTIIGFLKSIGIEKIYDSSFGSEISIWAHSKYIREHYKDKPQDKAFISEVCPAFVNTIELYHPSLIKKIIPVQSPSVCAAIYAKKYLNDKNDFVYLSSCVAKKDEIASVNSNGIIKYSITYSHLFEKLPQAFEYKKKGAAEVTAFGLGRLISASNGFKECISYFAPHGENLISLSGLNEYNINSLEAYTTQEYQESQPTLVDIHACLHGCIEGPGIELNKFPPAEIHKKQAKLHKESVSSLVKFDNPDENFKNLEKLFAKLDINDFHRNFTDRYKQPSVVPQAIYDEIFNSMYKTTEEKRNINCCSCGYKSCKDMVTAIAYGYNKKENCIHYMNEELERRLYLDYQVNLRNKRAYIRDCTEIINNNPDRNYLIGSGDINKFKVINDLYGNNLGDCVLKKVADKLEENIGKDGIVARLNGGQFAFCIEHTVENLEQIRKMEYFDCSDLGLNFPVTMRWGLYVTEHIPEESVIMYMINCTNLAMDKNVSQLKNTYTVFTKDLREQLKKETFISTQLKPALENNEFKLWFQPQYSASTGELSGAETLCRWILPNGDIISPGLFIPIAEKNGFIRYLDQAIWEMSFKTMRKWFDEGLYPIPISVNISRISLDSDTLIYVIKRLQNKYNIPPAFIHFEVTESAYIQEQEELVSRIQQIRDLGFQVAMDDFGSGYSSLNILKDIPIDILKLDMGFLRSSENKEKGGRIISSIISMAQNLKYITVAEGVETEAQAIFLKNLGCDIIQGYYYAKPMPEENFIKLITTSEKHTVIQKPTIFGEISSEHFFNPDSEENLIFEYYSGPSVLINFNEQNNKFSILKSNPSFSKLLNKTSIANHELYIELENYLNSNEHPEFLAAVKSSLKNDKEQTFTIKYQNNSNSQVLWLKNHLWRITSIGNIHSFFVLIENITSEKYSTELFSLMNTHFKSILNQQDLGMSVLHVKFENSSFEKISNINVIQANKTYCNLSGYSESELLSFSKEQIFSLFEQKDLIILQNSITEYCKNNCSKPIDISLKIITKQNETKEIKILSSGTLQKDGSIILMCNYFYTNKK